MTPAILRAPAAALIGLLAAIGLAATVHAQVGPLSKISGLEGNFVGAFENYEQFGSDVDDLGDFFADGSTDLVVGALGANNSQGPGMGSVWILDLGPDGRVEKNFEIGLDAGSFGAGLETGDQFGAAVATLGDLDGNGQVDIAVGAPGDDDGGLETGAVWILLLGPAATVQSRVKIGAVDFGAGGPASLDRFGAALASVGDLDGDGLAELLVGSPGDDDGGNGLGAAYVLFLTSTGELGSSRKISRTQGGFGGVLDPLDGFGSGLDGLGDVDGDGVPDAAVVAANDDDGGTNRGAVWVLFLTPEGTVRSQQKISQSSGGGFGPSGDYIRFGRSLTGGRDWDGDGRNDLCVGALDVIDEWVLWIAALSADGTVQPLFEIAEGKSGFDGPLQPWDEWGSGVAAIGDVDGDAMPDLAVCAALDRDGGLARGAVWVLSLTSSGLVAGAQKISDRQGGLNDTLKDGDRFGTSVASIGDLDGDGFTDLAVGAPGDDDGGANAGAVWILFLDGQKRVKSHQKISNLRGSLPTQLSAGDAFGTAVEYLGDLDGDGIGDIIVGAPNEDFATVALEVGGIHVLLLRRDGTVRGWSHIDFNQVTISSNDLFGTSIARTTLFHRKVDLIVGAPGDGDGFSNRAGSLWLLGIDADGTLLDAEKLSNTSGGVDLELENDDRFGTSVARAGDLDGDGVEDLVAGGPGAGRGTLWLVRLNPDGTVKSFGRIDDRSGNFSATVAVNDGVGGSAGTATDLNGDGRPELLVGAPDADDGGTDRGSVFLLAVDEEDRCTSWVEVSTTEGASGLDDGDRFGSVAVGVHDLDGDGIRDFAFGAASDDDGGPDRGAVYLASTTGPMSWSVRVYGCANPPGSLLLQSGRPRVGEQLDFEMVPVVGTLFGPRGFLAVSLRPDPNYPCGTLIPGWGMESPTALGEVLVSLRSSDLLTRLIPGSAGPARATLPIPSARVLVGTKLYVQGLMWDFLQEYSLVEACEVTIGP